MMAGCRGSKVNYFISLKVVRFKYVTYHYIGVYVILFVASDSDKSWEHAFVDIN